MNDFPDDDDPLEHLIGELRTLAVQDEFGSLHATLYPKDAARLVAEIDRLRALTWPPPGTDGGNPPEFTNDPAAGFEPDELPRW